MINKKDFIELEFTGRVKDGEIFDSNVKEDLAKLSPNAVPKPMVYPVGEKMFLDSIDEFLTGKDIGEYEIELTPEKAFGNRDSNLIKRIPLKIFLDKKINPRPGMVFNFDNMLGKVIAASGGRVIIDFNNPLAGKNVSYKLKVLRKVDDINEKVKSLMNFFFQREFEFEIQEKKLIVKAEKPFSDYLNIFKDKFREILDLDLEVKELETKKEENKE